MENEVIESLARALVRNADKIVEWFNRPEVKAEYETWLKQRNEQRGTTK